MTPYTEFTLLALVWISGLLVLLIGAHRSLSKDPE